MLEHLSFETSAVHAGGPQTAMKSFKDFSRLPRKKRARAYVLMNQHGNGEAGAANELTAVNFLAAAGLRADAASFEPGKGQGKKMARRAVESRKYDVLIMFGGDGSINKGVQAVVDADNVSLGVICGGTVNHVSRMFYGNHDSKQWWVNILRLMQSAATSVDVGTIDPTRSSWSVAGRSAFPRHCVRRRTSCCRRRWVPRRPSSRSRHSSSSTWPTSSSLAAGPWCSWRRR